MALGLVACDRGSGRARDSDVDVSLTLLREGQIASGLDRLARVDPGEGRPEWAADVVRTLLQRRALDPADSLLALHPDDTAPEWIMLRAELREYQGRFAEARELYASIPGASPYWDDARTKMAMIAALEQDHQTAMVHAREVLERDAFDRVARAVLAEALLELGRPEEAHGEITQLPDGTKRWMLDARIHLAQGEPAGALEPLRKTLELTPGAPRPLYFLGRAFLETGQWALAAKPLEKLASQQPPYEDAQLLWSTALRRLGQEARADSALAEYHRSTARREVDQLRLAGIQRSETGELEEALDLFQRALEQDPDHPHLHNDVGTVLARLRRYPEAEASFLRAAEVAPSDPTVPRNLANLYHVTGDTLRRDEAVARYRELSASTPASGLR